MNLRPLLVGLLLTGTALAQTTWLAFEDRRGHAIASQDGGPPLLYGGESTTAPGLYRSDLYEFSRNAGQGSWTSVSPPTPLAPRSEHAMATLVGTNDIAIRIIFGGYEQILGTRGAPSDVTILCSGSNCSAQPAATGPSARVGHAMLTDTNRNVVVLFGGLSGGYARNDVWEYTLSGGWVRVMPQGAPPPARFDHAMAFHPGAGGSQDGLVYVFGGSGFDGRVWEFDVSGTMPVWRSRPPTPNDWPVTRRRSAMAYLEAVDQVVLYGGQDATLDALDDTWAWDRATNAWTDFGSGPQARSNHAMAPDAPGTGLLLVGGEDDSGESLAGTWLWDGAMWIEATAPIAARSEVGMVYDRARRRHVAYGGREVVSGQDVDDILELEGATWLERSPQSGNPRGATNAAMAYDIARQRAVVWANRRTTEWDGVDWVEISTASEPPVSDGVQLVYDAARARCVSLVGSETWSYDGTDWRRDLRPSDLLTPGPMAVAFDLGRGRIVRHGGRDSNGFSHSETWERVGGRWLEQNPTRSCDAELGVAMAYDEVRGQTVLVGGTRGSTLSFETWLYDGVTWRSRIPSIRPDRRLDARMCFDPVRQYIVLFGGRDDGSSPDVCDDTWTWDGSAWTEVEEGSAAARYGHGMAFDVTRNEVVLFGGRDASGLVPSSTMAWDGMIWREIAAAGPSEPSPRVDLAMVRDRGRGCVVLHGGTSAFGRQQDTWEWDGSRWGRVVTGRVPPGRSQHAMVYDETADLVTLVGGVTDAGDDGTTWGYDGTDWRPLDSGAPDSRTRYGAAYDERRDCVVVFGGLANGLPLGETWEWNGETWRQRQPSRRPAPRFGARLAYDVARSRVVLFGGSNGVTRFGDTWEWDGEDWQPRLPFGVPPASVDHGLSYDTERNVTLAFGADGTWEYGPTAPARFEAFGQGCVGANGVVTLAPKPWAGPWLGDRVEIDIVNRPPGFGFMTWGFSDAEWGTLPLPLSLASYGAPGCFLYVSADINQVLSQPGNPYVSFALPADPLIVGAAVFAQAGFLAPGGAPTVSDALRMTIGSR